jgi:hypothetical protein
VWTIAYGHKRRAEAFDASRFGLARIGASASFPNARAPVAEAGRVTVTWRKYLGVGDR